MIPLSSLNETSETKNNFKKSKNKIRNNKRQDTDYKFQQRLSNVGEVTSSLIQLNTILSWIVLFVVFYSSSYLQNWTACVQLFYFLDIHSSETVIATALLQFHFHFEIRIQCQATKNQIPLNMISSNIYMCIYKKKRMPSINTL